jgi:hypothetical protein
MDLGVLDYTCVLDVQYGCALHCRMHFRCHFQCQKLKNDIENAFNSETHIQSKGSITLAFWICSLGNRFTIACVFNVIFSIENEKNTLKTYATVKRTPKLHIQNASVTPKARHMFFVTRF